MSELLLTIAIPTYNRSFYLDRNLTNILMQYSKEMAIEILISDNASTDDTQEVIKKFTNLGLPIRCIRNFKNEGVDYNIGQCYWSANGKFVLVLGDDDILLKSAIKKILYVIMNASLEIGVIHLKSHGFKFDFIKERPKYNFIKGFIIYADKLKFIKKISHYVTFISANIVNTNFVDDKSTALEFKNSNLIQVSSILKAILGGKQNIYVTECLLMGQMDNSGGYDLFDVFGKNLYSIYHKIGGEKYSHLIMNEVIMESLPFYINRFRKKEFKNYSISLDFNYLKKISLKYKSYWFFLHPLLTMPKIMVNPYFNAIRIFNKVKRDLRLLLEINKLQRF